MGLGARWRAVVRAARGLPSGPPQAFPAGAFYSPIVDPQVVLNPPDGSRVWPERPHDPPGLDLRGPQQLALLGRLAAHPLPPRTSGSGAAYDPTNDQFPPHDAAVLYAMVRLLQPSRIVEIGCGWSTTVTAAAIEDGGLATKLTCIEPYPRDFLRSMGDVVTLREERVELTPQSVFDELEAGDICFIDSSHVVKTGSDVVHELLEVVPRLADGVVVHVHDVFIPEDYPRGWVEHGFNWNEQYLLQAFLVGNTRVEVLLMNHFLAIRHPDEVRAAFGPIALNGSSVWFATGPVPRLVG
ncbi:MAG: class I SAM-dependent methyltransferase [Acidimicrobiales bacterium]